MRLSLRAFTLLECLVVLLVLSGTAIVIRDLSRLTIKEMGALSSDQDRTWHTFCGQLTRELEGTSFIKVESDKLYVKHHKKQTIFRFGQVGTSDDFRKTNQDGKGYQPMLYGVDKVKIQQEGRNVRISIWLKTGKLRVFIYQPDNCQVAS